MNRLSIYLIFLTLFFGTSIAAIYNWVDEQGKTHYSDIPPQEQSITTIQLPGKTASETSQQKQFLPYEPYGSTAPGIACQGRELSKWLDLFCHFFTEKLWVSANKPAFLGAAEHHEWMPFFDANSGVLEGLKKVGVAEDKVEKRYFPWSRFFREKYHCKESQILNPFIFQEAKEFREVSHDFRKNLLGLNWKKIQYYHPDLSRTFEEGSMFVLFTLANLQKVHDEKKKVSLRKLLFNIAKGSSAFEPDYKLDAKVVLVTPKGTVTNLDTLVQAAESLATYQVLFTNDFMKGWGDGLRDAKMFASKNKRPLLYIYMAQNILELPHAKNNTYRNRFEKLLAESTKLAPKGTPIMVISHGWSSHVVASSTSMLSANIRHIAIGPSPGPWGEEEYIRTLKRTLAKMEIQVGEKDFVSLLGGGSYLKGRFRYCL